MQDRSTAAPIPEQASDAPLRKTATAMKAVLFDAGDVIYRRRRNPLALAAFFEQNGLPLPDYEDPPLKALKRDAHVGHVSRDVFFNAVLEHCGAVSASQRETGRAILAAAQGEIDFFPGVPKLCRR